ncbi:hypothetical protein [Aliivibrio fischeri]|uniref:hypothetical protein n=1 Tax=Aliivibrio fischeri TaxID=668 RepID=UPI0012D855FC|nr:hypothetical protein [Aliivibrio fischeri]MUI53040.1 hypothetical protein [Aliivibrio fischeri]
MSSSLKFISFKFINFFFLLVLVSMPVLVIRYDVLVLQNTISEQSATEYVEQLLLLASVLSFAYIGWDNAAYRRASFLIAAFFSCMLIREFDAFFDNLVYHGFWAVPAITVALIAIGYGLTDRNNVLLGLSKMMKQSHFPVLCLGLAILLVFSRLFGMGDMWQQVMGDGYLRVVKNMVEEGSELLGYTVIFYASINYVFSYIRIPKRQRATKLTMLNC